MADSPPVFEPLPERAVLASTLAPTKAAIDLDGWVCPVPLRDSPVVVMGHGGAGAMSAELIEHLFLPAFGSAADAQLGDAAVVGICGL